MGDELAAVRLILRRRRYGRASFRTIATELQAAGHATKRGGRWWASSVRAVWARRHEYAAFLVDVA